MRARIRAGDAAAFGQVFDQHAGAVYRHAVRANGSHAGADDVVSLTFLEAWRIRDTLRPEGGDLRPWLLGIATNVLRNRWRTMRRHRAAMLRLPPADHVPDIADEVAGRIDDAAQLTAAAAALRRLRRTEREVFLLCVWSQLDYAATAEALGVPVGTVRSRLSRARTRLRALAEEEMNRSRAPAEPPARSGPEQGDRAATARSTQEEYR
ncbi:RNA polymerase sigma factor [Jidongwangia harbinensis]|uniref:RNA polymerase sigma factor n=1 Tax=Jidongwangia harbinensis TaxID=2878561 RepID=UPI001CDA1B44|nr:RNA polymerase sigma factor [Jidongwangia harbinensis]MCA2217330.1 RNA polymerase sigma factor [Jidongwangia harbinensis]